MLDSILGTLEDEIRKSLEYKTPDGLDKKDIPAEAHKLTVDFLASLPRVREILQTDVQAAFDGDPAAASKEEIIVSYPFIEAISVQRLAHELYLKNVALIPRIMAEWAHSRTGMDLHPGAKIGSHFFVDHGTGTVVGETAVIGNHRAGAVIHKKVRADLRARMQVHARAAVRPLRHDARDEREDRKSVV